MNRAMFTSLAQLAARLNQKKLPIMPNNNWLENGIGDNPDDLISLIDYNKNDLIITKEVFKDFCRRESLITYQTIINILSEG